MQTGASQDFFNRPTYGTAILLTLSISTGSIYCWLNRINSESFTQSYLLSIVAKLLIGGIMISTMIVIDKASSVENALTFIITYFIFTALEVFFLFKKVNN
jgi:hypothetical protein